MVEKNPFGGHDNGEYWLAYELSPKVIGGILDFGCGDGCFISQFRNKTKEIYGCDIDLGRLDRARKKYPSIKFVPVSPNIKLPFASNFFDLVFAISVLEHVESPAFVLGELARVLKKKGQIIIHVPHRGLLAPLDAGNLKFRFPGLHRFLYSFIFGKEKYRQEFLDKKKIKMFGDFPLYRGMWHRHFGQKELENWLLKSGLYPQKIIRFSFFLPLFNLGQNLFQFLFKRPSQFWHRLIRWDNHFRLGNLSYDMILLAEKK